ncbi:coiled-coil domain-containing protein 171-like [Morone saxatilis]|uniref:coiled-coil domain-containing protein 171-like n=1 Tax=Morone saxatilis TaxID=34816 RepID=UPI0015E2040C|nr:coiled-coil domain-containing protein 171-like [Morone saxatilis]
MLEEEVRRLAAALGGEEDKEEEGSGREAVRRWRRCVCVVLAVRRWRALTKQTTVLFRVERGGGEPAVGVCGGSPTATQKGRDVLSTDKDGDGGGREGVCARWLRSKCLSSTILSSVADLQGALTHTGSSPADVMSASRSALSRLLDHLLDQSDATSCCGSDEETLSGRLRLGLNKVTPPRPNMKTLVSTLQQHFLLFSQRLHSAEVERRSLRLEVTNLKRGLRREREDTCRTHRRRGAELPASGATMSTRARAAGDHGRDPTLVMCSGYDQDCDSGDDEDTTGLGGGSYVNGYRTKAVARCVVLTRPGPQSWLTSSPALEAPRGYRAGSRTAYESVNSCRDAADAASAGRKPKITPHLRQQEDMW